MLRLLFTVTVLISASLAWSDVAAACNACKDRGEIPCRIHRPPTAFTFRHSPRLAWTCCLGTGKRPCPKCKPEDKIQAMARRREALARWVEERRKDMEGVLFGDEPRLAAALRSNPIRYAESDSFRLVSNVPSLAVRLSDVPEGLFKDLPKASPLKKTFPPELYDWIVLKRCEDELAAFRTVFMNQGPFRSAADNYHKTNFKAAPGKYDIFLWAGLAHHRLCGEKFFGMADNLGRYKHGSRLTTTLGIDPDTRYDDGFHRYQTHILHHLFLEAWDLMIGYDLPSWIPEGFAHYMEFKRFGNFRICCVFERKKPIKIPKKLKVYLQKLLASRRHPSAASLIQLKYNQMDEAAHVTMFSFFHYLIEGLPREKFIAFIRGVKRQRDQLTAFKTAYGFSLIQLDEAWRTWALKTYRGR